MLGMKNKNVWRRGTSHSGSAGLSDIRKLTLFLSPACMFGDNFTFSDGIYWCEAAHVHLVACMQRPCSSEIDISLFLSFFFFRSQVQQ